MEPIKDYGSFTHVPREEDADIDGHHTERWQHHAMYVGLHFPKGDRKKRHHRRHNQRAGDQVAPPVKPASMPEPPSQRVQFILGTADDDANDMHRPHDIFCEMDELRMVGDEGEMVWKETARWIKFEEDVEEGGERWSKPHVATLSLHSLFELRKGIMSGTVMLDVDATNLLQVTGLVLDSMVATKQLDAEHREAVQEVLLTHHHHQHQKHDRKGLPTIRSLADINKKGSERRMDDKGHSYYMARRKSFPPVVTFTVNTLATHCREGSSAPDLCSPSLYSEPLISKMLMAPEMKTSQSAGSAMHKKGSSKDLVKAESGELTEAPSMHKFNEHFFKKIPAGAEASNILVGEVEFLSYPIIAFVRLSHAVLLGDLTEVPVPTRFLFILLGPQGNQSQYHEIGRSIATLMSDEVFHDVAYKARNREDLLAGIDEFLDMVTVLPPGEWDPTIRIEPPKTVPSQEGRKTAGGGLGGLPNGKLETEEGGGGGEDHGDGSLIRTGRLFGGLVGDVRRKVPFLWSDVRDAFHIQCIASVFFMYFACLAPIVTFGGLLGAATDDHIAAMESLLSGAICGISYHLFSGQPLTVIGSTGPVLVFETIVYNFSTDNNLAYLSLRFWIGFWVFVILMLIVMFDLSALVRYITRFTEESFAMLIALIFIVEAFKKLFAILKERPMNLHPDEPLDYRCGCYANSSLPNDTSPWIAPLPFGANWSMAEGLQTHCVKIGGQLEGPGCDTKHYYPDVFFLSCLLFILTFGISMAFKSFRTMRFFPTKVRGMISDFGVTIAIVLMIVFDWQLGIATPKLNVPEDFRPTRPDRGWVVDPFGNPSLWIGASILPALLATILIFMDQQITAVIVNRKENKLKKGGGYHLDLFLIAIQILICSILGTPWFVAATVLSINHVRSLTRESETAAPGERPKFLGIREQRVTGTIVFILVGLSGMVSGLLRMIPMPVLYGVFLFMGVSSMVGVQLLQRIMIIFMPAKYQPDYVFLRTVPLRRVHMFTSIQVMCLAILWAVKTIKVISIVFPLMVLAMCFVRKALDWVFTRHELKWLDDIMPESHKREKEEKKMMLEQELEQQKVIEMTGGAVNIPLKDGKSINIPVDRITYNPATNSVNISEEMSSTAIWKQLAANEMQHRHEPSSRHKHEDDIAEEPSATPSTVKFSIDGEDDSALPVPEIVVDPPSKTSSKA